jgi:hypothetical protein
MSEPMSSVEIEDVLTSIRRLVSDDLRPLHRPTPHPSAFRPLTGGRDGERGAAPGTDRLILTPALRVVRSNDRPIKTVIAALEVAVEAQDEPWESETGDEAPAAEAAGGSVGWDDHVWEDVITGEDPPQEMPAQSMLDEILAVRPEDPRADPTPMGAESRGPEAVPEAPAAVVKDHSDPVWLAQAEAEVLASLADDAAEEVTEIFTSRRTAAPVAEDDDDAITFDEEVLRDLVRDLIREELHGALGERITRNIRKLVRTEISRMLTAQTYE